MDKLEKYIKEHLPDFDLYSPAEDLWNKINGALNEEQLIAFIESNKEELSGLSPKGNLWELIAKKLDEDKLSNWVENNRESFNRFSPSKGLWDKIDEELTNEASKTQAKEVKMVPVSLVWKIAASFLVLLVSVSVFQFYITQSYEDKNSLVNSDNQMFELNEAEKYYTSLINEKKSLISNFNIKNSKLTKEFQEEISELDSMYNLMKTEFEESQFNENVMSAMIGNLQLRIEILNQQLQILDKVKAIEKGEKQSIIL